MLLLWGKGHFSSDHLKKDTIDKKDWAIKKGSTLSDEKKEIDSEKKSGKPKEQQQNSRGSDNDDNNNLDWSSGPQFMNIGEQHECIDMHACVLLGMQHLFPTSLSCHLHHHEPLGNF